MTESLFIYLLSWRDDVNMTSFISESRRLASTQWGDSGESIHIVNMEKIEKRAVIKICSLKECRLKKFMMTCLLHWGMMVLHTVLWKIGLLNLNVLEVALSMSIVQDASGPKDAANDMLNKDRRLTIRHIAETTSINCSTVHRIVSEDLGMSTVSAHWVPKMLTEEQKKVRVDVCTDLLRRLQAEPQTFLGRIVTEDEIWVHHFDPETKRQSMIWKHVTSPTSKKFKVTSSAGKFMATVFWDSQTVIMANYLSEGFTVTDAYYANELRELREALKSKRQGKLRRMIMHQLTPPALRRLLQLNVATNCCLIDHIRQI